MNRISTVTGYDLSELAINNVRIDISTVDTTFYLTSLLGLEVEISHI